MYIYISVYLYIYISLYLSLYIHTYIYIYIEREILFHTRSDEYFRARSRGWSRSASHANGTSILFTLLDLCVSSLRRGHANLLCIVPISKDDPQRESTDRRRSRHLPMPLVDPSLVDDTVSTSCRVIANSPLPSFAGFFCVLRSSRDQKGVRINCYARRATVARFALQQSLSLSLANHRHPSYTCGYIYIYIYIYTHDKQLCIYIYIYILCMCVYI